LEVEPTHTYFANDILVHNCRFCWDLGISTTQKYIEKDGRTDVKGGRPLPTVVRYHTPEYLGSLIEYLVKEFECDFIAWLDENLQTSITKTKGKWFYDLRDILRQKGIIPYDESKTEEFKIGQGGTGHAGLCSPEYLKLLKSMNFSYLDYGLESWSPKILRWLGKGSTADRNSYAIKETMKHGIRPIPNQIIGFPMEDWDSIYAMLDAWEEHGIISSPFIMTAYCGSEIYEKYKPKILEQYGGSLDEFLSDLEDAVKLTATVSDNFNPVELAGIQSILGQAAKSADYKNARRLLKLSEKEWNRVRGL